MALIVDQLLTRTARRLQDPNGDHWSADELMEYFNDGVLDFCAKTRCNRQVVAFTTNPETGNVAEYIPAGDVVMDELLFLQTSLMPLEHKTVEEACLLDILWYSNVGTPSYYLCGDYKRTSSPRQQVVFAFPVPDAPLTDLQGVITTVPPALAYTQGQTNSDVPDLPDAYHKALIYYACWQAYDSDETEMADPKKAATWQARYMDQVKEAKAKASSGFTHQARQVNAVFL